MGDGSTPQHEAQRRQGQIAFWLFVFAVFVLDLTYGLMSDAQQAEYGWDVVQLQLVAVAAVAFLVCGYENTYRKIAVFLVLIYAIYIAGTDWIYAWYPPWGAAVEATVFLGWLAYVIKKIRVVQGGQETGRPDRLGWLFNGRKRGPGDRQP